MQSVCNFDEVGKSQRPFATKFAAQDDKAAKSNAPQSDSPEAPHSDDPVSAAMQARVEVLEAELIRLTNFASSTSNPDQQENYWDLAQQLQGDVREARAAIQSRSQLHQ